MRRIPEHVTANARALRNNATGAERTLWQHLGPLRPRFTRQLPIGPYIADFACRAAKLVVELDGRSHDLTGEADTRRDAFLRRAGWTVIRIPNADVANWPEGVARGLHLRTIEILEARQKGRNPPPPLPEEGGEK